MATLSAQSNRPVSDALDGPLVTTSPMAIPLQPTITENHNAMDYEASTPASYLPQTPHSTFGSPASPQNQSPLMRTPGENPDTALWRDIHLDLYDDPRLSRSSEQVIDWQKNVQQREHVRRITKEWGEDRFSELPILLGPICETLLGLYRDIPSLPTPANVESGLLWSGEVSSAAVSAESLNIPLLESILRSPVFDHLYYNLSYSSNEPTLRPLSGASNSPLRRPKRRDVHAGLSMLHCLLPPVFELDEEIHRTHRGHLRETVYSGNNYSVLNDWGPFTKDGKVDWRLLDAISMANARDVISLGEDAWCLALGPLSFGLEAVRGWGWNDLQRPADLPADAIWDWAGVEGVWCGSYAFLDYADWVTLNQPRILPIGRQLGPLDLTRYSEAIGDLLHMHLTLDRPTDKPADARPPVKSGIPTGDLLPPIHFHGHSAQSGATWPSASASFVKGTVQLTTDWPPQLRWTMVIRYGGEDRWRVEGVQVGGRGSKRGFFGVWTDATREEHSPNGPAWYWKA